MRTIHREPTGLGGAAPLSASPLLGAWSRLRLRGISTAEHWPTPARRMSPAGPLTRRFPGPACRDGPAGGMIQRERLAPSPHACSKTKPSTRIDRLEFCCATCRIWGQSAANDRAPLVSFAAGASTLPAQQLRRRSAPWCRPRLRSPERYVGPKQATDLTDKLRRRMKIRRADRRPGMVRPTLLRPFPPAGRAGSSRGRRPLQRRCAAPGAVLAEMTLALPKGSSALGCVQGQSRFVPIEHEDGQLSVVAARRSGDPRFRPGYGRPCGRRLRPSHALKNKKHLLKKKKNRIPAVDVRAKKKNKKKKSEPTRWRSVAVARVQTSWLLGGGSVVVAPPYDRGPRQPHPVPRPHRQIV